jgi:CxxC motif-containing protein (DUF1111 family)
MQRGIDSLRFPRVAKQPAPPRATALYWAVLGAFVAVCWAAPVSAADRDVEGRKAVAQGREIFEREWLPGDARSHGGDGLGPVYNDSSCVACHNLGGAGGGGSNNKNVDIITAFPNGQSVVDGFVVVDQQRPGFLAKALGSLVGIGTSKSAEPAGNQPANAAAKPRRRGVDRTALIKTHPGFKTSRSVVLHQFGTADGYEAWRQSLAGIGDMTVGVAGPMAEIARIQSSANFGNFQTQATIGPFNVVRSQRNPTALYGAGLIDAIPDRAIEAVAKTKHFSFPEIGGRVSRLKDKRVGRFGWKAQTPSLEDFVLTACAVELGLEVPGHHQGGSPLKADEHAKGLDLTAGECSALVAYVRDIPRPTARKVANEQEAGEIKAGRALFTRAGCATCHTPKLGDVDGLYSDLLLHDMGPELGDTGQYGVFDPSSSDDEIVDETGPIADANPLQPAPATALSRNPFEPDQPQAVAASPLEPSVSDGAVTVTQEDAPNSVQALAIPASPMVDSGQVVQRVIAGSVFQVPVAFVPSGKRPTTGPASRVEWRTPPLWGFRDSGPYLHDGRAKTLEQAVALHGGEASRVAQRYFKFSTKERRQVEAFLKSLTAPSQSELLASAAH